MLPLLAVCLLVATAAADKSGWTQNEDGSWTNPQTGEAWGSKSDSSTEASGSKDSTKTTTSCGAADALRSYPAVRLCITHDGAERCWYEYAACLLYTSPSPRDRG